jgi:hypothetical protein
LAIFEAIKKRDSEATAQAMAEHMASASKHLLETLSTKTQSDEEASAARASDQTLQRKKLAGKSMKL